MYVYSSCGSSYRSQPFHDRKEKTKPKAMLQSPAWEHWAAQSTVHTSPVQVHNLCNRQAQLPSFQTLTNVEAIRLPLYWVVCLFQQERLKVLFLKETLGSHRSHFPPVVHFWGMIHEVYQVLHKLWWILTFNSNINQLMDMCIWVTSVYEKHLDLVFTWQLCDAPGHVAFV